MEDSTAQSIPQKRKGINSKALIEFPMSQLGDFDLTVKKEKGVTGSRRAVTTRSAKKGKTEGTSSFVDLESEKIIERPKSELPLTREGVKQQFRYACDKALQSGEKVFALLDDQSNEIESLKIAIKSKDQELSQVNLELKKAKAEVVEVTRQFESEGKIAFEKMEARIEQTIENSKRSAMRSVAGARVKMALKAKNQGFTIPEEWNVEKMDRKYVRLGGKSMFSEEGKKVLEQDDDDDDEEDEEAGGMETDACAEETAGEGDEGCDN